MSKKFIGIMIGFFILVTGAFFLTLHWGSQLPLAENVPAVSGTPAAAVPKPPSVTLTIATSKKGNTLVVRWENLPSGTAALDIFRSTNGKSNWSLWKTITILPGDLASGTLNIDIGSATFATYSFYIEAMAGGGNNSAANSSSSMSGGNVLWASPIIEAPITTSTPSIAPALPPAPSSTPSSSAPHSPVLPSSTNTNPSSPGSNNPPAPSGTPYYTPQIQISGYGAAQPGNFWVQHIDQKIEIGWQNLPAQTSRVTVLRSEDANGPWSAVLVQEDSTTVGPYTIQVVDDTLGSAYYYKMNASAGNTTFATYGPVFLSAIAQ